MHRVCRCVHRVCLCVSLMDPCSCLQFVEREAVARALVRLLMLRHEAVTLVTRLNAEQIASTKETSTLFRGNSLATKVLDWTVPPPEGPLSTVCLALTRTRRTTSARISS